MELFLRDLEWLRVYTQMKRFVASERMRITKVKNDIRGPMSSSLRHHLHSSSVALISCVMFTEFIAAKILNAGC